VAAASGPALPRAAELAWIALAIAVLAALVGLGHGLCWAPDATNRLRDDAFYEFTWATNLTHGIGPIVSHDTPTSGVQYLWTTLLATLAWLLPWLPLPLLAPWLGFSCHVLTAMSWLVAGRYRFGAALVALLWLGNPLLVRECQNGQETALACLLASLMWHGRRLPESRFFPLAMLAVFARSDLWGMVAALSAWRHALRPRLLVTPLLALAPLIGCNLVFGGDWLQDSARPMAWLMHAAFAQTGPDTAAWLRQEWWFLRPVLLGGPFTIVQAPLLGLAVFLLLRPLWPARLRLLPPLVVALGFAIGARDVETAAVTALLLAWLPRGARRRLPLDLLALAVGLWAIVVLHWAVRWYPRDYYLAPLMVLAAAALLRLRRAWLLVVAAGLWQLGSALWFPEEPLAGQEEMLMAGRFLPQVLPATEIVGCFNSGLVTFYRDPWPQPGGARVCNLDGLVDHRAFAALRAGRLSAWLDQQQIRFVLDNPVEFGRDPRVRHACGTWFGPEFDPERDLLEVARFDVPGLPFDRPETDSFRLYWRRGHGSAPLPPAVARDLGPAADGGRYVLWPAAAGAVLETEDPTGVRLRLVEAAVETTFVVKVQKPRLGTGRLFERGAAAPLLQLAGL